MSKPGDIVEFLYLMNFCMKNLNKTFAELRRNIERLYELLLCYAAHRSTEDKDSFLFPIACGMDGDIEKVLELKWSPP